MKKASYLIVVGGATASGKTAVAIRLAQHFGTEILSADSRQFYREMNIGTAKPSPEELAAAPHHFVDFLSIEDQYTVGDFERDALARLETLFQTQQYAVLCGGSGLFLRAVCEGLDKFPEIPTTIRQDLVTELEEGGIKALQAELLERDPAYYQVVDLQNPQRVIRALEVCRASGTTYSSFRSGQKAERPFKIIYLHVYREREELYQRINQRVDHMIEAGLEAEAKALFPFRQYNTLQTVGYQEFFAYFEGKTSYEEAIELIKRNSRRYAKRQLTWLRKRDHWKIINPNDTVEAWLSPLP